MKIALIMPSLVFFITAVGCSGGGSGGGNANGDHKIDTASHKVEYCPQINGEFTLNGGESSKTIKSEKISSGLNFEDTEVKFIIDGTTHSTEIDPQASYRGSCQGYSIIIDVYHVSKQIARAAYSWNDKAQLVIEYTAIDTSLGQSRIETWDPKK